MVLRHHSVFCSSSLFRKMSGAVNLESFGLLLLRAAIIGTLSHSKTTKLRGRCALPWKDTYTTFEQFLDIDSPQPLAQKGLSFGLTAFYRPSYGYPISMSPSSPPPRSFLLPSFPPKLFAPSAATRDLFIWTWSERGTHELSVISSRRQVPWRFGQ